MLINFFKELNKQIRRKILNVTPRVCYIIAKIKEKTLNQMKLILFSGLLVSLMNIIGVRFEKYFIHITPQA